MKQIRKVSLVIFYNSKNQLLLQERWDYSKWWEEWAFFGWGIEDWETAKEAFFREAKEELGLDMAKFDYNYLWEFIYKFPERTTHRNIFIIKTDLKEDEFRVFEWIWAKYFSIDEARKLKFPSDVWEILDIIEKYIQKNK